MSQHRIFYHDVYDERGDKKQLQRILVALEAAATQFGKDECGAWQIRGSKGKIYSWGDQGYAKYLLYVRCHSKGGWSRNRRALTAFGKCTQDGDDEGVVMFDHLPTPDEAKLIRRIAGLRKAQPVREGALNNLRGKANAKSP